VFFGTPQGPEVVVSFVPLDLDQPQDYVAEALAGLA
jgi:hypothetical protein